MSERTLEEALKTPPAYQAGGVSIQVRKVAIRHINFVTRVYARALVSVISFHDGIPEDEDVLIGSLAVMLAEDIGDANPTAHATAKGLPDEGRPSWVDTLDWFGALTDANPDTLLDLDHEQFAGLVKAIYQANRGPFEMRTALFRRRLEQAEEEGAETQTSPPASTESASTQETPA